MLFRSGQPGRRVPPEVPRLRRVGCRLRPARSQSLSHHCRRAARCSQTSARRLSACAGPAAVGVTQLRQEPVSSCATTRLRLRRGRSQLTRPGDTCSFSTYWIRRPRPLATLLQCARRGPRGVPAVASRASTGLMPCPQGAGRDERLGCRAVLQPQRRRRSAASSPDSGGGRRGGRRPACRDKAPAPPRHTAAVRAQGAAGRASGRFKSVDRADAVPAA